MNFLKAVRPPYSRSSCPSGFQKCSTKTSPANTICYDTTYQTKADICPITDIKIVKTADLGTYSSYT